MHLHVTFYDIQKHIYAKITTEHTNAVAHADVQRNDHAHVYVYATTQMEGSSHKLDKTLKCTYADARTHIRRYVC